jgi:hypothetical protein
MRVRIYWNFHQKRFSLQREFDRIRMNGTWKTWLVTQHPRFVLLKDATFTVSEAGRARVLAEGRKNVHAYITGELVVAQDESLPLHLDNGYSVRYNPYKDHGFIGTRGAYTRDVFTADLVSLYVSEHDTPIISATGVNK